MSLRERGTTGSDGLYNEDRNLLRIRERERRNQEAHQEQELFLEKAPLFGEPYKTNKGDELSSRIQSMLGNYEEVTELIDNHAHQDFIGIPKSTASTPAKEKPGRPLHTDKTQPPSHHPPRPGVPPPHPSPGSSCSTQHSRQPPLPEHSQKPLGSGSSSLRLGQAPDCHQRGGDAWSDLDDGADLPALLPALSPPAEPLSPLHSSEPSDGEPLDAEDEGRPEPRGQGEGGPAETARKDIPSAAANDAAAAVPLPSQTFPPPLPSKTSLAMPQKPTAYVRPMDGQDQAPSESPDLKPSPDDFHGQSYGNFSDLKMAAKAKLSSLKIPSQPAETLSNEAHCVEEILREMTHSWPPPLTAIHTPSTSEPSKFPFPGKESQHVNSGFVGQKQCGPSQKAPPPTCQQGSAAPETSGVVLTHSSGGESASSSESESTSGSESESESSSSDGEEAPQPPRSSPPAPENEKSSVNKWQLDYWLVKVNQQNSHADSQGDLVPSTSPETKQHGGEEGSPAEGFKPKDSCPPSELSDGEAKGAQEASDHPPPSRKSPACTGAASQKQPAGGKQPRKPAKVLLPEGSRKEESGRLSPRRKDPPFTEKPKVKTKNRRDGSGAQPEETHKSARRAASGGKNCREPASKRTHCEGVGEGEGAARAPSPKCESRHPSLSVRTSACLAAPEPKGGAKRGKAPPPPPPPAEAGGKEATPRAIAEPPRTLVVKIELRLLSRIPQPAGQPGKAARKNRGVDRKRQEPGKEEMVATPKVPKKRPAEPDGKSLERKKPKLDKELKPSSSHRSSHTAKLPKCGAGKEKRKAKAPVPLAQEPSRGAGRKRQSSESGTASNAKDTGPASTKHKRTTGERAEHPKSGKKATQSSCPPFPVPSLPTGTSKPSRPLLKFDDKQYPVEHYMKEAKTLKHKADSMADKTEKAFNYLDAAVSFIESGIAMETDPQTPKSPYTMFSETLDLIRFILKLKNFVDPSALAREKDFAVLCMRCQSLLQMAMFRYKREAALKYSRTLTEHFRSSSRSAQAPSPCVGKATGTASPMSPMPSPASSSSSGPGSNHSTGTGAATTVAIPQVIQQVASSYVSITALFLSAHEIWEQAEALAHRSRGLLEELNSAMGPLSLTSSIRDLVRHTRQGLQWLRLS
ncbi:AF4/FMR2 family member 1 isoform X1 [Lepisosteus oculatus]|uniref:AF4/FMR2 family member 1 isoform X1 n=1 Tax=Lepisosteus oculatus TaxID=7918 RepID=UPI00371075AE